MWKHCNFINPPKLWKKELEMSLRPTWGVGDVATLPDWKVLFHVIFSSISHVYDSGSFMAGETYEYVSVSMLLA